MKDDKEVMQDSIWVLVYTKPKEEKKANENLLNQGFDTFLPLISPSNKNIKQDTLVPVFPRYLFAKINLDQSNWTKINSTFGVSNVVMFSDRFTSIPTYIIEGIQSKLDKIGVYRENISTEDYKMGDKVSIKEGRFAGLDAIFLSKKSTDRVRLLLKLLNTTVQAEVDDAHIGQKEVIDTFKF
tara:strand:+ start:72 stop:620 length:549 start_codon:yes stop_codon:yes gene_type:complete